MNGGVSWKYFPQLTVALLSAAARAPFSLLERMVYDKRLQHLEMQPPVFIVCHWRSGTTHICNLLSQSPQFGIVSPVATGIPHDLLIIGKLFKPWLEKSIPKDRLIDRVAVRADSPQEDEFGIANMIPVSFLHGLYFPKYFERNFHKGIFQEQWRDKEVSSWINASTSYLRKVYLDQHRRQLLVRNPAYTARVPMLRQLWPQSRFIHIYRNPYRVFPSMRNYFEKLLPAYAMQDYQQVDIEKTILHTYKDLMTKLKSDLGQTPEDQYIEVCYEKLEESPLEQLEIIYRHLGLPGFKESKPLFERYLDGIRGYSKNVYDQSQQEKVLIRAHWGEIIEHYGY
jgi:hypothetical protein